MVVRLNSEPHPLDEFGKEQWVMLRAREQGVSTPEVLALGRREEVSFQVQSFIVGEKDPTSPEMQVLFENPVASQAVIAGLRLLGPIWCPGEPVLRSTRP